MPRFSFKRSLLGLSCLLGLAAAIWFWYVMPPSHLHFMDMALSVITIFVGVSFIAMVFIFLALAFYHLVLKPLLSDH